MKNQKVNFWLMVVVGVPAFVWLIAELIRVFLEVVNRSGFKSVPFDGVIQHKVGELMVGAPLFLILLFSNKWPKEKVFAFINRTQLLMIVGGLLNGLAWYSLREREAWNSFFRVWCVILLFLGLFGGPIAKWLVRWSHEKAVRAS